MQIKGAQELGIDLTTDQKEQFFIIYKELIEWNNNFNLTSITSKEEIEAKHFLDSLTLIKAVDLENVSTLLDIGSGAGFPGIPLKIAFPHLSVTLIDSTRKKVNFMNHVIEKLALKNIRAIFCRSEDLPKDMRETFDVVTSRAVADLRVLCEYCMPYAKLNGLFVAYKGKDIQDEFDQAGNAISILGGKHERTVRLTLPGTDMIRNLIVIKKQDRTPSSFPRRAGMAKKNPL